MTGGIVSLKLGLVAAIALALIGFGFAAAPIPEAPQAAAQPTLKQEIKPDAEKPEEQDRIIRGRVLGHDGKPVVAEFTLFWNSGLPQSLGKTKDDGRFELTVPFRLKDYGGYLLARAPGHGFDFLPHGLPHVADSLTKTLDLEWKIPKERAIRGKLVDKEGRPIAGAILRVQYVFAYDTPATADRELVRWAKDLFRNNPLADRSLQFLSPTRGNADDPYPFATTTDADGKYELRGLGAEQLIRMHIEATGFAHRDIAVLNRDGYNPAPINQLERDRVPKGETRYQFLKIFGPDPTVALEQEKVIRGKITDPQGRPLAAIKVSQTRFDDHELNHQRNHAITGPDGIYEIHGAPKHDKYMVECPYETNLGLLPCQVWADSTPGYGPMTVDLKYTKGVLVTGRIVDKSTGEPLQALFVAEPMAKNPFLKKFGNFQEAATSERGFYTDKQGRFRIVTIPGPVLLMGGPNRDDFKPAKPDPKYPDYFRRQEEGSLLFLSAARGEAHVQGCWCRVIDAEDTEKEIAISIELEPASKLNVAVVDDRGQAVKDIRATGTTHILFGHPELFSGTNLVTVRNVEPDEERLVTAVHEKRKLIGWSMVKATDKMPKITLGTGGSARGRVIDPEGTPLAGILIRVKYAQRPLSIAHEELTKRNPAMTDEKGEFRLDSLFAEQPFQLEYIQDRRLAGDLRKAPWFTVKNEPEALRIPEATVKPPKK